MTADERALAPLLWLLFKEPHHKRELSRGRPMAEEVIIVPKHLNGIKVEKIPVGLPPSWVLWRAEPLVEIRQVRNLLGPEAHGDGIQILCCLSHHGRVSPRAVQWIMVRTGDPVLKKGTLST